MSAFTPFMQAGDGQRTFRPLKLLGGLLLAAQPSLPTLLPLAISPILGPIYVPRFVGHACNESWLNPVQVGL